MKEVQPVLSLRERDRRWSLINGLMKAKRLNCLIVAGLNGKEQLDGYITNDYSQGIVVFPFNGKPTYLVWAPTRITRNMEYIKRGGISWVDDYRVGATGAGLVSVLQEKGFDSATIGVLGLENSGPVELEGYIPYKTWSYVLEHLPKATFVDIFYPFAELMLVKSQEELELVRYGAQIGERACEAMLKVTSPGTSESEIYATIMKVIFANGAGAPFPTLVLHTGVDNVSWGPPMWLYQAQSPRVVQKGDILNAEIFSRYGGIETQQQMCVALKPIDPVSMECAEVARRAYKVGLKVLAPGKVFQEVADAMELPISEAGCWHLTPLIHSLSPTAWVGRHTVGIDQIPGIQHYKGYQAEILVPRKDLVIKPGMVFELEPNASRGKYRVNIGGTVIVKEEGVEELNKLSTEMRIL